MCIQEGLHQINLLSPAETKVTQAEYMIQKSGQKKLEETNKKIIADGLKHIGMEILYVNCGI